MNSFELYHEQYQNHVDELSNFLDGVSWDLESITISTKRIEGETLLTVHRNNKKLVYEARQMIGMIRLLAVNKGV